MTADIRSVHAGPTDITTRLTGIDQAICTCPSIGTELRGTPWPHGAGNTSGSAATAESLNCFSAEGWEIMMLACRSEMLPVLTVKDEFQATGARRLCTAARLHEERRMNLVSQTWTNRYPQEPFDQAEESRENLELLVVKLSDKGLRTLADTVLQELRFRGRMHTLRQLERSAKLMRTQLTEEELQALAEYARERGPRWKSQLNHDWMSGRTYGVLHELRNASYFGPSGLVKFRLPNSDQRYKGDPQAHSCAEDDRMPGPGR